MNTRRSPREVLTQFREDWAAAGEAADRWTAQRRDGVTDQAPEIQHDDVVIANDATIAGNVANHIVQQ